MKVDSNIRQAIESSKKAKLYDTLKKKKTLQRLEKDNETPSFIQDIFRQEESEPIEKKPYKKVSTFDIARQKYTTEESKRQRDKQASTKERDEQERGKSEYYKKRNTQKGRMLERKGGQPVMKHVIGDMLAKIKKANKKE